MAEDKAGEYEKEFAEYLKSKGVATTIAARNEGANLFEWPHSDSLVHSTKTTTMHDEDPVTITHNVEYSDRWFSFDTLFKRIQYNHENAAMSRGMGEIPEMKSVHFAVAIVKGRPVVRYTTNAFKKRDREAELADTTSSDDASAKRSRKEDEALSDVPVAA